MHIHTMTAGKSIDKTFLTINKKLKDLSEVRVLVEETIYESFPDNFEIDEKTKKERENERKAIIEAIDTVRENCGLLEIGFKEIRLKDTSLLSVRSALIPLTQHSKDTRLTFNLSGGTKMLSLATFVMALWLDAEIYLTPRTGQLEQINIPRMHLNDIQKNPNYIEALTILHSCAKKTNQQIRKESEDNYPDKEPFPWMAGRDFNRELSNNFHHTKFKGESKETKTPNKSVISKIKDQLEEWKLLEERVNPKSKREKEYRLTADGEWALVMLDSQGENI